ncbi:LacI family DNA-binding transcriptional regulator [soil metagenome]
MASTIHDVARLAGVSAGTVSRVINNSPRVDPATRARVLQVIEDLDFRPSVTARRLSTGRTHSIGVVTPTFTRPSVVERLRGISGVLISTEYELVVYNVETIEQRNHALDVLTRGDRADGLLLVGLGPSDDELARLEQGSLACVLVDAEHERLTSIVGNDVAGGRLAARHLLSLGHRKIAYVGEKPRETFNTPASVLRQQGITLELLAQGLDLYPHYSAVGEQGRGRARELAAALLSLSDPPTGILCASDVQALGVLEAARDAGLSVPRDVSIVGYDDLEMAAYLGLTTVRQPLFESGMQGARLLVEQLNGGSRSPRRELVRIEVVERSTSGPPPDD